MLFGRWDSYNNIKHVVSCRRIQRNLQHWVQFAIYLRGVELVQLLGFQGVTLRGKSKAGANTFVVAIDKLKQMHQETEMSKDTAVMDTNENRDITDGGVSGASDVEPAKVVVVVLVEKLKALFPPAPRVTFDDSF